ncbi:MAG: butyrate kinase [Candidatus Neomarinimicrobiota bacterium]
MSQLVLAINPGSTSTKLAVFSREKLELKLSFAIDEEHISKENVYKEYPFRKSQIEAVLKENKIDKIDIVIARGGIFHPMKSGAYPVNDKMIKDAKLARYGNHASNLGAVFARYFGEKFSAPAYIIDPVVVDEFPDIARVSGTPGIVRRSLSHALNIKATTRGVCDKNGWEIEKENFVVAHMGGGISVCAMKNDRMLDVNDALLGMGPFSPERAGALPLRGLLDLIYDKQMDKGAITKLLSRESGLKGYLGTNDVREVVKRIETGDEKAKLILDAMIYQIRKEVGSMAAVLDFKVKALIFTGGIAYSDYVIGELQKHLSEQFYIEIHPGENELGAMRDGGFRILDNKMKIYEY